MFTERGYTQLRTRGANRRFEEKGADFFGGDQRA